MPCVEDGYLMQFGFDVDEQNQNVLIGFGLTTAVVVHLRCLFNYLDSNEPTFPLQSQMTAICICMCWEV
jgi:hypothetical protein